MLDKKMHLAIISLVLKARAFFQNYSSPVVTWGFVQLGPAVITLSTLFQVWDRKGGRPEALTATQIIRTTKPIIKVYSTMPWPFSSVISLFRRSNSFIPFSVCLLLKARANRFCPENQRVTQIKCSLLCPNRAWPMVFYGLKNPKSVGAPLC